MDLDILGEFLLLCLCSQFHEGQCNIFINAACLTEPYTARSAQLHLARVLDLLRASGPQDALREGRSPSILETLTHTHTTGTCTCCTLALKGSIAKVQNKRETLHVKRIKLMHVMELLPLILTLKQLSVIHFLKLYVSIHKWHSILWMWANIYKSSEQKSKHWITFSSQRF